MCRKVVVVLVLSSLLLISVKAQQQRGPDTRGGGGGQSSMNRGRPGSVFDRMPSGFGRIPYLSGKVMLQEGYPPPEPVTVELVCNGAVRRQVYTRSKGKFSLRLDNQGRDVADASAGGMGSYGPGGDDETTTALATVFGEGTANLSGCVLRAELPGFKSNQISLSNRSSSDGFNVGTIVLYRAADIPGTAISMRTLQAPKKARKAYEKAKKGLAKEKVNHPKVVKELKKAVEKYPEFSAAWYLLGQTLLHLKDRSGAREAFQRATASESTYIPPLFQLTVLEAQEAHWEEVAQLSRQLCELDPNLTAGHYYSGAADFYLGNMESAEGSLRKVESSDQVKVWPFTHYMLGMILARKGDYPSAAGEFRRFVGFGLTMSLTDKVKTLLGEWEEEGLIEQTNPPDAPEG